ncbi:hypothetical protein [Breoghania sp.]|uniref:hypothetical protein n=1 Tax=Breoghania sp. TaxID=2065378 RepID=UPI002AA7A46F|nr:hypothetical protein [Breoghania sp.]
MKVGVICEGPTDFIVMKSFFTKDLSEHFQEIEFFLIQPALDNTLPGGWSQVLYWLENNPPENRTALYRRGQSLFLNEEDDKKFDALLFQMDTDIIGENGFEKFCSDRGLAPQNPCAPKERANFIRGVLISLAAYETIDDAISSGETPIAIVEACETWIVAAGTEGGGDAEKLLPADTCNRFGRILAKTIGERPQKKYAKINKSPKTREKLCKELCTSCTPKNKSYHYDLSLSHIKQALS